MKKHVTTRQGQTPNKRVVAAADEERSSLTNSIFALQTELENFDTVETTFSRTLFQFNNCSFSASTIQSDDGNIFIIGFTLFSVVKLLVKKKKINNIIVRPLIMKCVTTSGRFLLCYCFHFPTNSDNVHLNV